jgi:hypothetical protein
MNLSLAAGDALMNLSSAAGNLVQVNHLIQFDESMSNPTNEPSCEPKCKPTNDPMTILGRQDASGLLQPLTCYYYKFYTKITYST